MIGMFVKEQVSVCPICGKSFKTKSRRRKYCYDAACDEVRYQKKLAQKRRHNASVRRRKGGA